MAKIFNLDEMLDIINDFNKELGSSFSNKMINLGDEMAAKIAEKYNVQTGCTTSEGPAFGGTCASFSPNTPDQEMPDIFNDYDCGADWD